MNSQNLLNVPGEWLGRNWFRLAIISLTYGLAVGVYGAVSERALIGNQLLPIDVSPWPELVNYSVSPESILTVCAFGCILAYRRSWKDAFLIPISAGVCYDAEWTLIRFADAIKPAPSFVPNLPLFWGAVIGATLAIYWGRMKPRKLWWMPVTAAFILFSQYAAPSLDLRVPIEIFFTVGLCRFLGVSFESQRHSDSLP